MKIPLTNKSIRIGESETALEKENAKLKKHVEESGKKIKAEIKILTDENKRLSERAIHWRSKHDECENKSRHITGMVEMQERIKSRDT
jgi:hypothetical protein